MTTRQLFNKEFQRCSRCALRERKKVRAQQQQPTKQRVCSQCGAQIYEGEKRWILKDGSRLCIACYEKPRLCAGCGGQIEKGEKRWLGKNGTFLCIPCYEGRKKEEDHKKKMAGEVVKSLGYVGGFAAVTK
jgi:formylmethanofuran dehydrogenase subunit E